MSSLLTRPATRLIRPFARVLPFEQIGWRTRVAESGLPAEVQHLIVTVVCSARLWRFEKIEVVEDLIAHFVDGNARGRSFEKLIDQFGAPTIAAKLIHRSKTRNRPVMMKLIQISGWSLVGLITCYVGLLLWFRSGQPTPSIDYVAKLNQPARETADSDRAWLIYRPLWAKHGVGGGGSFDVREIYVQDDLVGLRLIRPTDEGWPAAVVRLQQLDELLDAFRTGSRLPSLGLELQANMADYSDEDFAALFPGRDRSEEFVLGQDYDLHPDVERMMTGSIINMMMSHLQSLREGGRLLRVDTRLAIEQQDADRATENMITIAELSSQAAESQMLVGGLVGLRLVEMAFDHLEEILTEHPEFLEEQHLAELQRSFSQLKVRELIRYEGERSGIADMVQRMYTDDGNGDGRITSTGLRLAAFYENWSSMRLDTGSGLLDRVIPVAQAAAEPVSLFMIASRKETMAQLDNIIDQATADLARPFWLAEHPTFDYLEESKRWRVLIMVVPAFAPVRNAMDRTIQRQEAAIAAIALNRYRIAHGEWPESLVQLTPNLLTEIPVDIIDGQSIRFTIQADQPLIYSVGNDHDDDGGEPPVMLRGEGSDQTREPVKVLLPQSKPYPNADGDWILWPQFNDLKDRRL